MRWKRSRAKWAMDGKHNSTDMITQNGNPMLANDMAGLGGLVLWASFMVGLWLVAFGLFLANIYLTFFVKHSSSFKIVNAQILGVYTILAFLIGRKSVINDNLGLTLVFFVPLMVIVHFVCLLVSVRRRRRRLANATAVETKDKHDQ